MRILLPLWTVLLAAACSSEPQADPVVIDCADGQSRNPVSGACVADTAESDTPDEGGNNGTAKADAGAANGPDGGAEAPDASAPSKDVGVDPSPQPSESIRFVAIGDTGTGSDMQRQVGQSIGVVCASLGGCDFGLLLGDNHYDSGVSSVDDSLWITGFVEPYGHLPFPFWSVLGNHDLGGDGLGVDRDQNKADYQIEYSDLNPQWRMPARYYEFTSGPVWFVGLNTTNIFFGQDDDQRADVTSWLPRGADRWKIAFGHHPYYSNGKHGNAGDYDGVPFIPVANGEHVRDFVEDVVCGNFDFYVCGHDHSRQDIETKCDGTEFLISGAGAKTTRVGGDNPVHFESDSEGFLIMEATATTMRIAFYDANGTLDHERLVTR